MSGEKQETNHAQSDATPSEALADSIIKSVWQAGISKTASEMTEIVLDACLDQGVLSSIPVFGWILRAQEATVTVRDRLFMKKIALFLANLSDISEDEINSFRCKYLKDEVQSRHLGEKLILLLDKVEEFDKASILGFVFAAYLKGHLSKVEFDVVSHAVSSISSRIIRLFVVDQESLFTGDCLALATVGLSQRMYGSTELGQHSRKDAYYVSPLGETVIEILQDSFKR